MQALLLLLIFLSCLIIVISFLSFIGEYNRKSIADKYLEKLTGQQENKLAIKSENYPEILEVLDVIMLTDIEYSKETESVFKEVKKIDLNIIKQNNQSNYP
jgi:hypothetical protein